MNIKGFLKEKLNQISKKMDTIESNLKEKNKWVSEDNKKKKK